MQNNHGKEQEVEKELFEWVKASEELPEGKGRENYVHVRCTDPQHPFTAIGFTNFNEENPALYIDYGNLSFLTVNGKGDYHSTVDVRNIEWLKPAAISHPTTTVLDSDIEKLNETVRQLKEVRNTYSDLNNRLSEDLRTANGKINELNEKLSQPYTVLGWVDVKDRSVTMPNNEDFLVYFDNGEIRRNMEDLPFAVATHWMRIIPPKAITNESKLVERKEGSFYVYDGVNKEIPKDVSFIKTDSTEGNILIAEFMNGIIRDGFGHPYQYADFKDENGVINETFRVDNLKYHYSWSRIMSACYKWDNIFKECAVDSEITMEYESHCDLLDNEVTRYEILPVFNQLVENIKWYNKIKNKL